MGYGDGQPISSIQYEVHFYDDKDGMESQAPPFIDPNSNFFSPSLILNII